MRYVELVKKLDGHKQFLAGHLTNAEISYLWAEGYRFVKKEKLVA